MTATSRDSAVGGKQGHAPSRNICCQLNSIKLTSGQSMVPHFIDIVVEVKAMWLPHLVTVRLGVSKGMLPVEISAVS